MGSFEPFAFTFNNSSPSRPLTAPFGAPVAGSSGFSSGGERYRPQSQQQQQQYFEQSSMDGATSDRDGAVPLTNDPAFDILDWHPAYQSCQRYFLDHAQHEPGTQALCALINIRLPLQWLSVPITSSTPPSANQAPAGPAAANSSTYFSPFNANRRPSSGFPTPPPPNRSRTVSEQPAPTFVSLIPYIRRLVVTGFDKHPILHGFFGDDYRRGVLPHVDCERRNYLFAAKHGGWRSCKKQYDYGSGSGGGGGMGDESVPFMKPLDEARTEELLAAEKAWSGWLAMEDWMVGPRAPTDADRDEDMRGDSVQQQQQPSADGGADVGVNGAVGTEQSNSVADGALDGFANSFDQR